MVTRSSVKTSFVVIVVFLMVSLTSCHQLGIKADTAEEGDETEQTRNIIVRIDGHNVSSTFIDGIHAPRISIELVFNNTPYVVDLTLNTYLLSPSYVEKIITDKGSTYRHVDQSQESCYYTGKVHDVEHSSAAFSTCKGIKGFLVLNNFTFHIKPLQLDADNSLVGLYKIRKATNDNLSQWICGIDELKAKLNKVKSNQRVKRQIIQDSLDGKNVVELYVANDARRLRYFNNDYNSLSRSTREIVNAANLLYQPVGFFIVLVGVEHWQTDQIEVVTDSSKTLSNWHSYRTKYILNNHYNDVGFLISRQSFDASVLGLASVGTMCSSKNSGGIMTAILDKSAVSGAILAHEIGHNFGLSHDAADCYCQSSDVSCIMSARASTDRPAMYFSACSKTQLRVSIDKGFDICLKDFPLNLNEHSPVCGNGILEQGEDCDCGRMPSDQCNPSCCNPSTCKLIGSAQCASGSCCEVNSCQLKQVNTQCRASIGPCDLPETCDGRSAFCPKNVYKHDGMSCSLDGVDAYCWKGMCRTHRLQCQELYGSSVLEGNAMCYQIYNPMGSINGWCSLSISDQINYGGCQQEDVMCGALQCNTNAASLVRYTNFVMQTNKKLGGFECKGSLLDYGSRVENPGMVPSGASCGPGKMCVSSKCVSAQSKLNENPCPPCVNGVCINDGTCLCDPGYFGPVCDNTEPSKSLSPGEIVGIILALVLIAIITIAIVLCCLKKDLLKNIRIPRLPNKVAPGYLEKDANIGNRSGEENQAYTPDGGISIISGNNSIILEQSGRNSYYPPNEEDCYDCYDNIDPIKFVGNGNVKTPLAQLKLSNTPWRINFEPPDIIPPTAIVPPVPAQHLKPRLENSVKNASKPAPPSQRLKPTVRAPLAPSSSVTKPPLPPASAKPRVTSPSRPKFPPKTALVTPPHPPTFPPKPKPVRPAPPKPAFQSTKPDVVEEVCSGDVRGLKAMFEKDSTV